MMDMDYNLEQVRWEQLQRCIPDILTFKSMLYVGGHLRFGRDLQMTKFFKCPIDCVEIWPENVKQLETSPRLRHVWLSDIRDFSPQWTYELTMFWHGPEHLLKDEVVSLLLKIAQYTTKMIVFATPNGVYTQGAEYGNPHEVHQSHWYPSDFEKIGMEVDYIGSPDKKQGNIIAWKRL